MIVLIVLPLAPVSREAKVVVPAAVRQDRYVDHPHTMGALVWADFCREDER